MSLFSIFFAIVFFASFPLSSASRHPVSCAKEHKSDVVCEDPLDPVTKLDKTSYIAKIPCIDCPYFRESSDGNGEVFKAKNDLIFNISLSRDRTELLLEHKSIFPTLSRSSFTIPPKLLLAQVSPDFARSDLNKTARCIEEDGLDTSRTRPYVICVHPRLSLVNIDYDYSATKTSEKNGIVQWEVTFDAIGGSNSVTHEPSWTFNGTGQKMLKVFIEGKEMEQEENQRDPISGSTPFGDSVDGGQKVKYKLKVLKVESVDRTYTFPKPPASTFWSRIARFFGSDPKRSQNHVVYHQREWAAYGKKGTLRNAFGTFIHETEWTGIFTVIGGILAGIIGLYGLYRLCLLIIDQRRLAQWGGIDEVWRRMRAGGSEEDFGLLDDGRYRDYPDDAQSPPPSYSDEIQVNKPLPSKPLPDKPLPAVPLIDDV